MRCLGWIFVFYVVNLSTNVVFGGTCDVVSWPIMHNACTTHREGGGSVNENLYCCANEIGKNKVCLENDTVLVADGVFQCKVSQSGLHQPIWKAVTSFPECTGGVEQFVKTLRDNEYSFKFVNGDMLFYKKVPDKVKAIEQFCKYNKTTLELYLRQLQADCSQSGGQPKTKRIANTDIFYGCACGDNKTYNTETSKCEDEETSTAAVGTTAGVESQTGVSTDSSETSVTSTECQNTIGQRECKNGEHKGYFVCKNDSDCTAEKTLPAHATEGHCVSANRTGYKVCTATKCDTDYTLTNDYCKKSEAPQSTETPAEEVVEEPAVVENADCTKSGGTLGENGGCTCDENKGLEPVDKANPQKCKCIESGAEYDKEKGECVSKTEQTTTVIVDEGQDEHPDCTVWDVENNKCKCDTDPNKHMETATDGSHCVCIGGYTLDQTTGVCIETPTATTTPGGNTQPTEKTDLETLTEKLDQAKEKYESARDKEQSLANRTLTAASTAATGLGTMAAASAYFEQQADADAEADMAAYLATFRCEYGTGQSVKSSNEEITLPGGNELLNYYSEYKTLADSLKVTKKALGLRPGIESEVLYDKAETGLYQYSSVGKTDGGFTSLARALTDETSDDAAEWAKQKDDTSTKLKAGGIAAGAGVVGGTTSNLLINNTNK